MSNVIWITGLSAAGKTTISKGVTRSLLDMGYSTIMLDGDILKECFDVEGLNTRDDRKKKSIYIFKNCQNVISSGCYCSCGNNSFI